MKKLLLLSGLLALLGLPAPAQENDFGMWNTFDVEGKISQRFSIVATEEMRLKENLTRMNLFYTNIGVSYRLNKHVKISPVYRFIQKYFDDASIGYKHRLMLDIAYKTKFSMVSFTTRTRLQAEVAYPGADDLGDVFEYYWRQKFDFKFDIGSKFTPYVGTELRTQFFTPHIKEFRDFGFSRTRLYAGCDYEINKMNEVGAYFLTQFDYQVNDPTTLYILGLEYSLTLDLSGKNKNNGPDQE
jgi:hypothetical protein